MSHTPGPWTIEPGDSGDESVGLSATPTVIFTTVPNASDRHVDVATIGSTIYDNTENGDPLYYGDEDANARLIAAAPDLLAALKDLRAMIIGEHGASAYENVNGEAADAAIAKAEGR